VRLVRLSIQPFRYNPITKELRVATDLTIHLDYSGFDGRNMLKTKRSQFLPQWEQIYRMRVLNFEDIYKPARINSSGPGNIYPGYLIIYAHDFRPAVCPKLQEFIDWKEAEGQRIYKADLNDITGARGTEDAGELKAYIQYWYDNMCFAGVGWVNYVLLVGDAPSCGSPPNYDLVQCAADDRVPTYWYGGALTSDYWYQLLSGNDNYPEIALGRWCVEHPESLFVYVDKTFAYQKDPDPGWQCAKSALIAHKEPLPDSGDPVGASLRFELAKDTIYNNVLPSGYDYELLYGAEGATNADLIQAITTYGGTGIVNYRGHGSPTSWDEWDYNAQSFTTTQMRDLDQTSFDGYPVVYNLCCSPGPITNPTECVIEAWTRNPEGGCAGALGAANAVSYTPQNNTFDTTIFRGHFLPNSSIVQSLNCGMAINHGKVAMLTHHGDGEYDRGTLHARGYHWIGDPELDIWRESPVQAYVAAPDTIYQGQEYVDIYVHRQSDNAPVPWATGCLLYVGPDTGYFYQRVERTNEAGFARIDLPVELVAGDYLLTVTSQTEQISIMPVQDSIYGSSGFFASDVEKNLQVIGWNLEPVLPNVLRSQAAISYSVAGRLGSNGTQSVKLSVFDITGREVKVLTSGSHAAGHYTVAWDGKDEQDARCAAGVYFIRMRSHEFNDNARLILLR